VREFGREHRIETVILRLPLVYGPGVKGNFAALVDAVRERRSLPLGAIRNQRSLLGVTNLCAAIDAARVHSLAANETFFVSDGEDVSTPELVRAIGAALGVRPRLWRCPPPLLLLLATLALRRDAARRLLDSFAIDNAKIRRTLGWTPLLTLADELQRLAEAHSRPPS
jgi:nucleoside-diphosphate-sugar epimerase